MQYVIETKRLCKTYGGRTVVHNLDLHVPQGCVYGFIGPNGAGKSTSMKMLLGLVHPTAGSVAPSMCGPAEPRCPPHIDGAHPAGAAAPDRQFD